MKKRQPSSLTLAFRQLTASRKALKAERRLIDSLQAAVNKHGGTLLLQPLSYGLYITVERQVSRMGEIASLLRAARLGGAPKPKPPVDDPAFDERRWRYDLPSGANLTITAKTKPDGVCRFVQVSETVETVPARPATTVVKPVYKLLCEG